ASCGGDRDDAPSCGRGRGGRACRPCGRRRRWSWHRRRRSHRARRRQVRRCRWRRAQPGRRRRTGTSSSGFLSGCWWPGSGRRPIRRHL
ncbi:MAG: hypothetical protein EOO66_02245, partial [Methylobacterium sp.]